MISYVIRRILLMIPTLAGILAVVFFVMAYSPGGLASALRDTGAQSEGKDAKRGRKLLARQYGLDQPRYVQFGRWLNQVSPLGFQMSADIEYDDATRAAVAGLLRDQPFNSHPTYLERGVDVVTGIAAYTGRQPTDIAGTVIEALAEPGNGFALFELMNLPLTDAERQSIRQGIVERQRYGLGSQQNELIRQLGLEMAGQSRVVFSRPRFKAPDFGFTKDGRRVTSELARRVPITVLLNALAIPFIYGISIVAGMRAAWKRGGLFDKTYGGVSLALWSVPTIWAGAMLITYFANVQHLRWFPAAGLHDLEADAMAFLPTWGADGFERGWLLDTLWHMVLPVVCMSYGGFAVLSKVMRGSMLDTLSADFVRTARSKGLPPRIVLWRHVFRNSILPLITMLAGLLPGLLVGSVVVESIFSIEGMGKLAIDAAKQKEINVVMATTLIGALLSLACQIIRDVCYAMADPRVSYE
jgi:ABC-type dipeptide/oligopeptide/nickel transport system permease component